MPEATESPYRVMLARTGGPEVRPRPADQRPFLVTASSHADAVRAACEQAVLDALSIRGKPSLPVDVRVVRLENQDEGTERDEGRWHWTAEVVWRSSGCRMCWAAGSVQRWEGGR